MVRRHIHPAQPDHVHHSAIEFMVTEVQTGASGVSLPVRRRATVISVYMDNVDPKVVRYQAYMVDRMMPSGWKFDQYLFRPKSDDWAPHAFALSQRVEASERDIVIILDIDCVPLTPQALIYLYDGAAAGELIGCIQRANHLSNGAHLYVGPFCMAFDRRVYYGLGSPTFVHSQRGDTGEELTYHWEAGGRRVRFIWPSHCEQPMWELDGSTRFGLGTTYAGLFYHTFNIRDGITRQMFIDKCLSILQTKSEPKGRKVTT